MIEAASGVGQFFDPFFLPGSKAVLVQNRQPPNPGYVEAIDLQTRTRHRLLEGSSARLAPTGDLLFVRQGKLWAVKFDAARLALDGTPVPVLDSAGFTTDGEAGEAGFATSSDGSLVYLAGDAITSLVWLDRAGSSLRPTAGS